MRPLERGIRLPRVLPEGLAPLPPQTRLTIPLLWGETALVRVGERVRLGQRIADGAGDLVPVHASASGRVEAVAPRTCADGKRHTAIVIASDGQDAPDPGLKRRVLLDELDDESLLTLLYEAGIRLPDGTPLATCAADAGPALHVLILSAIDHEPGLYAEDAALRFETEDALSGLRVLQRLLKPQETVVAVGSHQREAVRAAGRWTGLRLAVLADAYPAGHPRLLAEALGGLMPGQSFRDGGVLVVPVSAAAACGRAVYEGLPVVRQTVGVEWGQGRCLLSVPIGAPVRSVLQAAGHSEGAVLLGGPMTGAVLEDLGVPVAQGMTGLTILPAAVQSVQTACIRCGRCADVCPVGLQPYLSQTRRPERFFAGCLRCGACQYVCPAGLPLLRAMGHARKEEAILV